MTTQRIDPNHSTHSSVVLAAIDIGSNAARILIKRVDNSPQGVRIKKLQFVRIPLRLGMDVFANGTIGNERRIMLLRTMKAFRQMLLIYQANRYLAYATSAFRDARNGTDLIREIKKKTGLQINVISGEEEARIIHDNFHAEGNLLYMDVGGGSTEFSLVCDGQTIESRSVNIGTIRLLKETVDIRQWDELAQLVTSMTAGIEHIRIVGSGGNINKLNQLAGNGRKSQSELSVDTLISLYEEMSQHTAEELMDRYDLSESRADVIVPAAKLFIMVARHIGSSTILVPNVGLADGMINLMAQD